MARTVVYALAAFILSSCATSGAVIIPAAHQADVRGGPPVEAPPTIRLSVLPGWTRLEDDEGPIGDAFVGYRNEASNAVINAMTVRAGDETPGTFIRTAMSQLAETEHFVCEEPVTEGTYAITRCVDSTTVPPRRGLVAVRRPGGRPDHLLLMTGVWPDSLPTSFDDEVDLMFLIATAE